MVTELYRSNSSKVKAKLCGSVCHGKIMHSGLWFLVLSIKIQTIKVRKGLKLSKIFSTELVKELILCYQKLVSDKLHTFMEVSHARDRIQNLEVD